jgi:hypothetical protein
VGPKCVDRTSQPFTRNNLYWNQRIAAFDNAELVQNKIIAFSLHIQHKKVTCSIETEKQFGKNEGQDRQVTSFCVQVG